LAQTEQTVLVEALVVADIVDHLILEELVATV
jgi:hypothetical protein